jgi:hypothetical protein
VAILFALLVVLGVAAGATYSLVRADRTDPGPHRCNGAADLCERRLDEVSLATTHNSMNSAVDGFSYPSQGRGIDAQLEDGVRGFLVDAYLGSVRTAGTEQVVYTELSDRQLTQAVKAIGDKPAQHALRLRKEAGPPDRDAPREVYLCHQFCELGAVLLSDVVETWGRFLEEHPSDVLVVVIQDELPPEELVPLLEASGLDRYVATIDPSIQLPTLGSMVESDRRLVIGLENGDLGPAIPNVYESGLLQEVPYKYSSLSQLEDENSCRPHRGDDDAPLFLLNHWISPPSPELASEANAEDVLLPRAERCAADRGQRVNLVAVDFYESGDLFATVDELNEEPAPQ